MNNKDFQFTQAFSYGFSTAWKHLGVVAISTALLLLFVGLLGGSTAAFNIAEVSKNALSLSFGITGLSFVGVFIFLPLLLGYFKILLEIHDRGQSTIGVMFSCFSYIVTVFVAYILYALAVGFGTMLFIIPGLIFAGRFILFPLFIIDKNLGAIDSLRYSWRATAGHSIMAALFYIAIQFIAVIGALVFGIGILYTFPAAQLAMVYLYRQLTR